MPDLRRMPTKRRRERRQAEMQKVKGLSGGGLSSGETFLTLNAVKREGEEGGGNRRGCLPIRTEARQAFGQSEKELGPCKMKEHQNGGGRAVFVFHQLREKLCLRARTKKKRGREKGSWRGGC